MATIAAWVTHLKNGEILWERFHGGSVEVTVFYKENGFDISRARFGVSSENWDEMVKVLTLKEKKDASVQ